MGLGAESEELGAGGVELGAWGVELGAGSGEQGTWGWELGAAEVLQRPRLKAIIIFDSSDN
jgi:hypothetical protein